MKRWRELGLLLGMEINGGFGSVEFFGNWGREDEIRKAGGDDD